MKYSNNKDFNSLIKQLIKQNWIYIKKSKHGLLKHTMSHLIVTVSSSPSDQRAYINFKQEIYRKLRGLTNKVVI